MLETIFCFKPEDFYILIWTLPHKNSRWFRSPLEAERYAVGMQDRDVYVGVGLSPKDFGPNLRCPTKDIAGIVGLWIDVDFLSPAHKKGNLPPDENAARALLTSILPPSVVIHTGHGLQG